MGGARWRPVFSEARLLPAFAIRCFQHVSAEASNSAGERRCSAALRVQLRAGTRRQSDGIVATRSTHFRSETVHARRARPAPMRRSDYAWLVLAAGAARVYAHKGHHHADAKGPLQLGLVAKNAYGVEDCAAGCVVEPYRETVLVVTRSDDDREAQLDAAANALQIASELAAIAHSLGQAPPADRAAWLKEERARLEATLKEAEAAERGHDHDIGVLTLQRAPAADAGHAHDGGDEHSHHCHGGDCHAHHAHGESDAHDHGGAADHAHGDAGHAHHAHGEDEHCHGGDCHVHHDHGASEAVHDHGGDEHCHNGDCHSHHEHCEAHAHDHGAPESHEHDHGAPEAHAHDHGAPESHEHDHGGEEQCEQPIELGAGRRVVVGNTTLTEPGAYILAVETKGGKAIFQVDVRHARRAATALTPADRSRFLQAIVKLYETPAARGRQKYGAAFRSMDELWAAHALLGADGEDHDLLAGTVGAAAAADLVENSKPLRVPSEVRDVGGHRLEVKGDQTDWETFGQRFVGQASFGAARGARLRRRGQNAGRRAPGDGPLADACDTGVQLCGLRRFVGGRRAERRPVRGGALLGLGTGDGGRAHEDVDRGLRRGRF